MKSVLISIRPKWCEKIASGDCNILVKKSAPKEVPFKAYIYETKESKMRYLNDRFNSFLNNKSHYTDMGKVIGEFICDRIEMVNAKCSDYGIDLFYHDCLTNGCLTEREIEKYFNIPEDKDLRVMKGNGYAWHISDLKIYDKPLSLSELGVTRPPQSYMFVEEVEQ
jgi:predicted transcriptional regulator